MNNRIALLIVVVLAASFLAGCDPKPEGAASDTSTKAGATPKNRKLSGGFTDTE